MRVIGMNQPVAAMSACCSDPPGREHPPLSSGRGSDRGRNFSSDAYREIRSARCWQRTEEAFFAAGACHILAWACRDSYPEHAIELAAVRFPGAQRVIHTFATWNGSAYDHSGWNPEQELLAVKQAFEGLPLERIAIMTSLSDFCEEHFHRMPDQFWSDPLPRARDYVMRHQPPWRGSR